MDTHISQTIDSTPADRLKYDTNIKELLADKQILARILKYTLEEFKDCDVNDIINEMDDPRVSKTKVEPGQTNTGKISKESEEDNVPKP